jgi:hypothetical protein
VVLAEAEQTLVSASRESKSLGGERLALDDRAVELDLVEPGCMDRQVDQAQVRVGALEPLDRGRAGVARAVVDDPEDGAGRAVGLDVHHLLDKPPERLDPCFRLDPVKQLGVVDIPAGQVGEGAVAPVVEREPPCTTRRRR